MNAFYSLGVELHFMVRLDRLKRGLGVSCEIGGAFQSRVRCSSGCRLLLIAGLPGRRIDRYSFENIAVDGPVGRSHMRCKNWPGQSHMRRTGLHYGLS